MQINKETTREIQKCLVEIISVVTELNKIITNIEREIQIEEESEHEDLPQVTPDEGIWEVLRQYITLPHGLSLCFEHVPNEEYYALKVTKNPGAIDLFTIPIFKPPYKDELGYKLNILDQLKHGLNNNLLDYEMAQKSISEITFQYLILTPLKENNYGIKIPLYFSDSIKSEIRKNQIFLGKYLDGFNDDGGKEVFLEATAFEYEMMGFLALFNFVNSIYDWLIPDGSQEFFDHCALDFYDFRPKINVLVKNDKPQFQIIFDGFNTVNLTMNTLVSESGQIRFIETFYDYLCVSLHSQILEL